MRGFLDGGGGYTDPTAALSPISVFATEEKADAMKRTTEVIALLLRRFRYLQQRLEDATKKLLRVLPRFEASQTSRFAMALALLFATSQVSMNVLEVLFADHVVREGLSLQFITLIFRYYLAEQSIESLSGSLRRSGLEDKVPFWLAFYIFASCLTYALLTLSPSS